MMADNNQPGDHGARKKNGPRIGKKEDEAGGERCRHERRKRDNAEHRKHQDKTEQCRQDGGWREAQKNPQPGGDPLSPHKTEKDRKKVAQSCHHGSAGLNNLAQSQPADNENGEETFEDISYEGQDASPFPRRAGNICCPYIPAPRLLDSDPLSLGDERASWNRATQIGRNTEEDQNAQVEV